MKLISSWLSIAVVVCVSIISFHMPVSVIYSPGGLLLVLGPQILFLLFEYGRGLFSFAARVSRKEETETDQENILRMIGLGMVFSAFGCVLGIIHIMRNLGTLDSIGPGVAICLMCIIYSAVSPVLFIRSLPGDQVRKVAFAVTLYVFSVTAIILALTFLAMHTLKSAG